MSCAAERVAAARTATGKQERIYVTSYRATNMFLLLCLCKPSSAVFARSLRKSYRFLTLRCSVRIARHSAEQERSPATSRLPGSNPAKLPRMRFLDPERHGSGAAPRSVALSIANCLAWERFSFQAVGACERMLRP